MKKYEIVWVFLFNGKVTELRTLASVKRAAREHHNPPPMSLEMLEVEQGDFFDEENIW